MNIVRHAITWMLSGDGYTTGSYANGDPWVLGPAIITGIIPICLTTGNIASCGSAVVNGNRTWNGSMLNPRAGTFIQQGFDSYMDEDSSSQYSSGLNVARLNGSGLSESNPLIITSGSLVSMGTRNCLDRPMAINASVLTVAPTIPNSGDFRPYYCGSGNKYNNNWNVTGLDWSILRSLNPVTGAGVLSTLEGYFSGVWIEIGTETDGRYMHPAYNQPDYGEDMANRLGAAMLSLHLNYTQEQKTTLYTRLVQYGIDVFGAALAGGEWVGNGGFNMGRKMPMILAGFALRDGRILASGNGSGAFIFQEDQQTFYVPLSQTGIVPVQEVSLGRYRQNYKPASGEIFFTTGGYINTFWPLSSGSSGFLTTTPITLVTAGSLPAPLSGNTEYITNGSGIFLSGLEKYNSGITIIGPQTSVITGVFNMIGVPEWGEKHADSPNRDGANWGVIYRDVNYRQWLGHYTMAKLTSSGQTVWNWPQYFDYMDRTLTINGPTDYIQFFYSMWAAYIQSGTPTPVIQYAYKRWGAHPKFKGLVGF